MEEHLQQVRAALEASASHESRQAGLEACRALTAAIEANAPPPVTPRDAAPAAPAGTGEAASQPEVPELCDPREVPPAETSAAAPAPSTTQKAASPPLFPSALPAIGGIEPAAMAAIVTTLRSLTPDQWLDLFIEKLKAATRAMPAVSPAPSALPAAVIPSAAPQPLRFQLVPIPPSSPRSPKARR